MAARKTPQMIADSNGIGVPCLSSANGSELEQPLVNATQGAVIDLLGYTVLHVYSDVPFKYKMGDSSVTVSATDYDSYHPANTLYDFKVKDGATHIRLWGLGGGTFWGAGMT